jgi:hypothetical protein
VTRSHSGPSPAAPHLTRQHHQGRVDDGAHGSDTDGQSVGQFAEEGLGRARGQGRTNGLGRTVGGDSALGRQGDTAWAPTRR